MNDWCMQRWNTVNFCWQVGVNQTLSLSDRFASHKLHSNVRFLFMMRSDQTHFISLILCSCSIAKKSYEE